MKQVKIIKLPKRQYGVCVVQHTKTGKKASFYFNEYGLVGFIHGNWFIDMFNDNNLNELESAIMIKIAKHYKW